MVQTLNQIVFFWHSSCLLFILVIPSGDGSGVASASSGFVPASGSGSGSSSGGGSGDGWSSIRKKRAVGLSDDEDY